MIDKIFQNQSCILMDKEVEIGEEIIEDKIGEEVEIMKIEGEVEEDKDLIKHKNQIMNRKMMKMIGFRMEILIIKI
jgi:methyl coenzyme M reductase gamma subunit